MPVCIEWCQKKTIPGIMRIVSDKDSPAGVRERRESEKLLGFTTPNLRPQVRWLILDCSIREHVMSHIQIIQMSKIQQ